MKSLKPLNAIQKRRAPETVSDESFAELKEQRAEVGESFRNEVFTGRNPETGTESKTWFDRTSGKWVAEFRFTDGSTDRLEANSRDDLLVAMAVGHAESVAEDYEAELEANPSFENQWNQTLYIWLTQAKWGKRFAEWVEHLPQATVNLLFDWLRKRATQMYGKGALVDARCIEGAYISLLDSDELLEKFERDAERVKKQRDAEDTKNAERDALAAEFQTRVEEGYQRSLVEEKQQKAVERVTADKKLSKSKKGMAELRRRALFGDKSNAFPVSTGTAKRN